MYIYKTTCLKNGKIYIGKSKFNNLDYLGSGISLNNAIKKYGRENFSKEILESTNSSNVDEREKYWIKFYNSTDRKNGYNISEGGTGGNTRKGFTELEMKLYSKKMSKSMKKSEKYSKFVENRKGKKRPNHSKKLKEMYSSGELKPWNLGLMTKEETRKKISKANTGKKRTLEQKNRIAKSKYKPVIQYDLDGNFIKEYESIKEAAQTLNIGRDSVYGCCVGKYRQGAGFIWKYKNEIV